MIRAKDNAFEKYTTKETFEKIVCFNSVSEMWENSVKLYADDLALATQEQNITYKELDDMVSRFRTVLLNSGVKQGDHVGIFMPNCIDFVKAYLAITTLGAVAVLLPAHLPKEAIFGCSKKFNLVGLVYAPTLEERLSLLTSDVKKIVATQSAEQKTAPVFVSADSPCSILFTGGTTGKSKGSLLSNGAVLKGVRNGCYGIKNVFGERYILVLPLTHVFGLIRNLLTSLNTGSALFICANNKDLFRDIAIFKPTIIVLVPALAEMALSLSKRFNKNMLGESLKTIICGAAFVPPYLIQEYSKLGISLLPGYGLTESANLVSGNAEAMRKPSSVGYLYPEIEAKIVDGELWLKGPNMQTCYYNDEENANAYEDGWFKTGDIAHFDEEGMLYITGRKKEIIVLSTGENVSPAELEAKFVEIDVIQDCLVYENERGHLELEVLIREDVAKTKNVPDIKKYTIDEIDKVNCTLPSFERITKTVFRDTDFVRSPSMKILRNANGYVKK